MEEGTIWHADQWKALREKWNREHVDGVYYILSLCFEAGGGKYMGRVAKCECCDKWRVTEAREIVWTAGVHGLDDLRRVAEEGPQGWPIEWREVEDLGPSPRELNGMWRVRWK